MEPRRMKMLNQQSATARISREMLVSERSIAAALVDITALLHSCAIAARDNHAPAAEVQAAFLRINKATAALVEARGEAARTHSALLQVKREVCGPEEPGGCPDPVFTDGKLVEAKIAA